MPKFKLDRRVELLKAMHTLILLLDDEDYYMWWIMLVPDEPTLDDFDYIAQDEELYKSVSDLFRRIVVDYIETYEVLD